MFDKRSRVAWVATAAGLVATTVGAATPAFAVVGDEAKDGQYAFSARIDLGEGKRSCSGALVDEQWVLTAASCFADDPSQGFRITGGAPKLKTVVTVGRTDLGRDGGATVEGVELVPRGDRDVVMVRLAKAVTGIAPAGIAAYEPKAGDELRVTGYGRTKDEWVPDLLHTAVFGVSGISGTTVDLAGKSTGASVCKGDTGGPAFREKDGRVEIAAVNSGAWQGGCFGVDETRTGAVSARVDDVNGWIQQLRLTGKSDQVTNVVTTADFNGDGRSDVAAVMKDGSLQAFYAGPDGTLGYGRALWNDNTWDGKKKIIGGDFNGDGKADILAVDPDGTLQLYVGTDSGKLAPRKKAWSDTSWGRIPLVARYKADGWQRDGLIAQWDDGSLMAYSTAADGTLSGQRREMWRDKTWTKKQIATGDFNGDGRDDIAAVSTSGGLALYAGNDKGTFDNGRDMWRDATWDTMQVVLGGDFNGDRNGDLFARWGRGSLRWYAGDGKGALADARVFWPGS
ncbi:trypsin-like serine protease [Streptomyces sp. NPDC049555]|uniref:trypsin-like serine protease n=1 Tax=unclassified Streptomyces TaxID=2593676 RepID=UPI0034173E13